jgi:predicted DNA-binding transcriptional regulator YafY
VDKYIGHRVEIIYLNKQQQISQRIIRIVSVKNVTIFAYDEIKKGPRSFCIDKILAIGKVSRHAS